MAIQNEQLSRFFNGAKFVESGQTAFFNADDMWRAAGCPDYRTPSAFLAQEEIKRRADWFAESFGAVPTFIAEDGATWLNWFFAIDYAKLISPEFHRWHDCVIAAAIKRAPVESLDNAKSISLEFCRSVLDGAPSGSLDYTDFEQATQDFARARRPS